MDGTSSQSEQSRDAAAGSSNQEAALRSRERIVWLLPVIVLGVIGLTVASLTLVRNLSNSKVSSSASPEITITAGGLNPATIRIQKGQSVVWTNQDSRPHSLAADQVSAATMSTDSLLMPGDTLSVAFDQPGIYTYHDPTAANELKGTIIVE